jgi:hypothetical protein
MIYVSVLENILVFEHKIALVFAADAANITAQITGLTALFT